MTIENNKKYKLTGEQIKDLAARISILSSESDEKAEKALSGPSAPTDSTPGQIGQLYVQDDGTVYILKDIIEESGDESGALAQFIWIEVGGGGIIELTTDDYDWNAQSSSSTPPFNSVALWQLPDGIYHTGENVSTNPFKNTQVPLGHDSYIILSEGGYKLILKTLPSNIRLYVANSTGAKVTEGNLLGPDVIDNLVSTSTDSALSANQGKTLKGLIDAVSTRTTTLENTVNDIEPQSGSGAPTSSTEGAIGQTYVDTTTGDIYYLSEIIEESGEPDSYVWKKIGDEAEEHNDYGKVEYYTDVTKVYNIFAENATAQMTSESTYEQFLRDNGISPAMVMFDYRETETEGEYAWNIYNETTGEEIQIAPANMLSTTGITVTIDDPSMPFAMINIDLQRTVNTSGPTAFLQLTSKADYENLVGNDTTTDPDYGPFGDQRITLYCKQVKAYTFPNWWVGYTPDKFLQSALNLVAIHSDYKLKMYSDGELQEVIPVDTIGNSFLNYCSNFNSQLNFCKKDYAPASYEEKLVFHIGHSFLNGCSALASPVCVWGSNSTVGLDFDVTVGYNFMNNCTHYTSQYDGNNFVYDLYKFILRRAVEIPKNFMSGCSAVTVIFGFSGDNIPATKIGEGFFRATGLTTAYVYATNLTHLMGAFSNCSSLTSITIANSPELQYIGMVGDGCSSLTSVTFTKALLKVTEVGAFCYNASSLATIRTGGSVGVFLPNVAIIGNYFLSKLPAYNSPIDVVNAKSIGDYFLLSSTTFNQDIAFNKLYSVGGYFMNNCNAFTSTVNIGGSLASVFTQSNYTLGTNTSSAALYTTGATVAGEDVNAFLTRFADRTSSPYRKLISGGTGEEIITNAGAPTTATVGTVGQLLEDTTNGKLYICTDATNPYVWEEVGAGGSGITELTSADYNWNNTAGDATTTPFDSIALWLLDPGIYTIAEANIYIKGEISHRSSMRVGNTILVTPITYAGPYTIKGIFFTSGETIMHYTPNVNNGNNVAHKGAILYEDQIGRSRQITSDMYDAASQSGGSNDYCRVWMLPAGTYYGIQPTVQVQEYNNGPIIGAADKIYIIGDQAGGTGSRCILKITTEGVYKLNFVGGSYTSTEKLLTESDFSMTMTSVDPGQGTPTTEGTYTAVYGGDPIILDYSLSEVNTGMKWIDGSAIYKKTVNLGTLPSGSKNVAHGISNLAYVIKTEGYAANSTTLLPLPYVANVASSQIGFNIYNGNIVVQTGSDRTDYSGYITLYYTKSS